jgi:hypothetical protein
VYVGAAENDPVTKLPNHVEALGAVEGFKAGFGSQGRPEAGAVAGAVGAGVGYLLGDAGTRESQIYYGTDPARAEFGAQRIRVDDGPRPFVDGGPVDAHSNYFDPEKDEESARNLAKVVSGNGERVSTQEYR